MFQNNTLCYFELLIDKRQDLAFEKILLDLSTKDIQSCQCLSSKFHHYINDVFLRSKRVDRLLSLKKLTEAIDKDLQFFCKLFRLSLTWEKHLSKTEPTANSVYLEDLWHLQEVRELNDSSIKSLVKDAESISRNDLELLSLIQIESEVKKASEVLMQYHQLKETVKYELHMAQWFTKKCSVCHSLWNFFEPD